MSLLEEVMGVEDAANETNRDEPPIYRVLMRVMLGVCIVGSAWSLLLGDYCEDCRGVNLGYLPDVLAPAGLAFYVLLFAGSFKLDWGHAIRFGVIAALGVHAVLLSLLAVHGLWCVPCMVTGVTAAANGLMCAWVYSRERGEALLAIPAGIIGSIVAVLLFGDVSLYRAPQTPGEHLMRAQSVATAQTVPKDKVMLAYFSRSDCPACEILSSQAFPRLQEQFGDDLVLKPLEPWEGLPVPLLYVMGDERISIQGLVEYEQLVAAVTKALPGDASSGQELP